HPPHRRTPRSHDSSSGNTNLRFASPSLRGEAGLSQLIWHGGWSPSPRRGEGGVRGSRILDSPSAPHPARFARHPLHRTRACPSSASISAQVGQARPAWGEGKRKCDSPAYPRKLGQAKRKFVLPLLLP